MTGFCYRIAPLLDRVLEPPGGRLLASARRLVDAQGQGLVIRARAMGLANALAALRQATEPRSPLVRLVETTRARARARQRELSRRFQEVQDEARREASAVIRPFVEQSNLRLAGVAGARASAARVAGELGRAEADCRDASLDLDVQRQRLEALRVRLAQVASHRGWP